jgi:hypothetical protein
MLVPAGDALSMLGGEQVADAVRAPVGGTPASPSRVRRIAVLGSGELLGAGSGIR